MRLKKLKLIMSAAVLSVMLITQTALATVFEATTQEQFKQAVTQGMTDRETQFTIKYTGNVVELNNNYNELIKQAYSANDYLKWSWSGLSTSVSGTTASATYTINASYYATKEQEYYVDKMMIGLLPTLVKEGMTNYSKVKGIHQWVIDNVEYDYSFSEVSAYSAIAKGKAVCQGYALLMYKMLDKSGVPVKIVNGTLDGILHAWNLVKIDGVWYHIDATNNDNEYNNYRVYLASDEDLLDEGYTWNSDEFPSVPKSYEENSRKSDGSNVGVGGDISEGNISQQALIIAATEAVRVAELYKTQDSISIANNFVKSLQDCEEKEQLLKVMSDLEKSLSEADVIKATAAVEKAEAAKNEATLDVAWELANKLKDSEAKTSLINRLKVVSKAILTSKFLEATTAVQKAEISKVSRDITLAENTVKALPESMQKNDLTVKLNKLKESIKISEAISAVKKAEDTKSNAYINSAEKLVKAMTESTDKTALLKRLETLKLNIKIQDATAAVRAAEIYKTTGYVNKAEGVLKGLPECTQKTDLVKRLNYVKAIIKYPKTEKLVADAEKSRTSSSISNAEKVVATLQDSVEKTALKNRLEAVKNTLYNEKFTKAKALVTEAEKKVGMTYVKSAESAIRDLKEADKNALASRLNAVKVKIQYNTILEEAKRAVALAEKYKTDKYITLATGAIYKLPNGTDRTVLEKRIEAVKVAIITEKEKTAIAAVEKAEKYKTKSYKESAQKLVSSLSNATLKAALQKRLDNIVIKK